MRPLELGAHIVVHSVTKYLAGHGDVMGGVVVTRRGTFRTVRRRWRGSTGPVLGPFESYLTMRGIKTFPLRMERQCSNACRVATWLAGHPRVERVYFPGDPKHPDAATIRRLFPAGLFGAMVSFELKDAGREEVFRFMERLKMVVRATSLGDVHTMMLYPAMCSHRDLPRNIGSGWGYWTTWSGCRWGSKRWRISSRTWTRRWSERPLVRARPECPHLFQRVAGNARLL